MSFQILLRFTAMELHPQYSDLTFANDIAVFTLRDQPLTNNFIQPACIANEPYSEFEDAIVAGWGTLSYGRVARFNFILENIDKMPFKVQKKTYSEVL